MAKGVIRAVSNTPEKLVIKYGVQARNHNEIVINATLANLYSALALAFSEDRSDATFIFFACSLIDFS